MRKAYFWALLSLIGALALAAVNCGASGGSNQGGGASGNVGGAAGAGGTGEGGDCLFGCETTASGQQTQQLILSPTTATLNVENGTIPTQAFTVTMNGSDVSNQVSWSFTRPDIGGFGGTTTFTPSGAAAGVGTLTVRLNSSEATAQITVYVKKTVDGIGLTPQEVLDFNNPQGGADPSMSLVYPYNETVFPLDVLAPEIQWNGAANNDVYQLKITEQYYEYTTYFTTTLPARHLIDEADWKSIQESGTGPQTDPLKVSLTRRTGGTVYQPAEQTWRVARGRLKGSVYYWELPGVCQNGASNGRILRIKASSPSVDTFFNPGVCWGCHTVSRDGTRMAAEFNDGGGPLYTLDLTADPVAYAEIRPGTPGGNFIFSAYNNDGSKLLASENNSRTLRVIDTMSGATLNPNAMGSGCGEPAWSPDGQKVAAVCNMNNGGWTFDSGAGDLMVGNVGADGFSVDNINMVVPRAGGTGRPAYPSFSPGSEWIAFGRPTSGSRSTGAGMLHMVRPDGQELKTLTTASSDNKSFNPVFAPLRAGGYYWLVFISRRDYGNRLVSANRQQLWITAISDPPTAADPSNPPFFLRGQELCALSENAYYALDPCKPDGESCQDGSDCCNGQCVDNPGGDGKICGEPEPGTCAELGNSCETAADCCDTLAKCIDNFCQLQIQ
ncbi:hypothetical protein [Chondromyces crocatus]|uniref:Uncharacterized protein n=1 Tax=Chondromyces crocatus TaxID=52 RepID=A0A0K1EPG4_CHOCO|nr:hypothetical protein [Chondromyces crocatus]AKT42741.1 uncharacterized protein CMC5_069680 [Chondromyces crocatus]